MTDKDRIFLHIGMQRTASGSIPRWLARFRVPQPFYRKRFGKQAVAFIRVDRAAFRGGDIIADFCHRVGRDPADRPAA